MKQIVILMMFAFNLNASTLPYQSWQSFVAVPQPEMYGFLKDSPSFRVEMKAFADSKIQELVSGFNPSTTDPTEIAKLAFAKAILQGKDNSPAFLFLFNELFNQTYVAMSSEFASIRDEFTNAIDNRFENLSLRWVK